MGFFKDLVSNPVNLLVGGAAFGGAANLKGAKDARDAASQGNQLDIYNNSLAQGARVTADAKKKQYYGNTLDTLGRDTEDYTARLKSGLDKNTADADIFNQQAGQQRAVDNARAGLSGVDTAAMNEQGRRNASFGASAINEKFRNDRLDLYGKSIGNKIGGASQIDNSEMALAISQMKQPQVQNKPGLIGSLLGGFV